ncbi:uncharacterized protein TNCV_4862001 [Trichonephila clavipes]|nr:uncharacterized protein TNCV_4862001 [Trichonephila clavipes]
MKTYLLPQVVEKIMPVYQRLASDTILERCVAGKTQNSNESLHSCIWRKCPKEVFVSKRRLEIAVTDAIEKHNLGYVKSLEAKEDSCLNDSFSLTIAERQDKRRISQNISTKQKKGKEMPRIQMQPIVRSGVIQFSFMRTREMGIREMGTSTPIAEVNIQSIEEMMQNLTDNNSFASHLNLQIMHLSTTVSK